MPPSIVTDGLVAHYHAAKALSGLYPPSNSPGTTAWHDLSGNGYHGTLSGALWEPADRPHTNADANRATWYGREGSQRNGTLAGIGYVAGSGWEGSSPSVLALDGGTSQVSLGSITMGTGDRTVECWAEVYKNEPNNHGALLVFGNPNLPPCWGIIVNSSGAFGPRLFFDNGAGIQRSIYTTGYDGMKHVVAIFDRDGLGTLYIDGVVYATTDLSPAAASSIASLPGYIGSYPGWNCKANIAAARVYDRVLTPAEVAANYAAGPNGDGYVKANLVYDLNAARAVPASGWAGSGTEADPYCARLDGAATVVNLPASLAPRLGDFSIEAVVRHPVSVPTINAGTILSYGSWNFTGHWGLWNSGGDVLYASLGSTGYTTHKGHTIWLGVGAWRHVVATFDRDGLLRSYLDGAATGSTTDLTTLAAIDYVTAPTMGWYSGWYNKADVALVRLYHRVLSPAEVARNYAAGTRYLPPNVHGLANCAGPTLVR